MRNAFIEELIIAAESNKKIALMVGDLGYGVVEPFSQKFPKQFFNAGVAEQNMMGMAAGLASEGFHVFVYSIANFPTFRCAEQIRNDVDYHKLPVTIVSIGGGLAYGNLGYSHHALQDYALMRILPNLLIAAPGDPMETRACMRYLINHPQPSYLRLGKAGEPCMHASVPNVEPGQWLEILKPKNAKNTVLTTGCTLDMCHGLLSKLGEQNEYALHSLPLWGMQEKKFQSAQINDWQQIITVEDHLIDAGFGSWLLEAWNASNIRASRQVIHTRGLSPEVCGQVGKQSTLNAFGGLAKENILPK